MGLHSNGKSTFEKHTIPEVALRVPLIHKGNHTIGKTNINLPQMLFFFCGPHTKIQVRISRFNSLHNDLPSILVQITLAFLYLSSPNSRTDDNLIGVLR